MGLLFCLFLIVLGMMAAGAYITRSVPAFSGLVNKLLDHQEIVGFLGFALGLISLFMWLMSAHYIIAYPLRVLMALFAVMLELGLGLIFGMGFLRKHIFRNPALPLVAQLEAARLKLLPWQQQMGIAALIIGIIFFCKSL